MKEKKNQHYPLENKKILELIIDFEMPLVEDSSQTEYYQNGFPECGAIQE